LKRFTVLALIAIASTTAAQPSSKARADATDAYKEGQRRYLDEDYIAAATQFEVAYKLDPDPAYLFNIAQAYRLAKDCTKALPYYKQFLAAAPKAPNAPAVNKYIAELEASCAKPEPSPLEQTSDASPSIEAPREPSHVTRNLGIGALGVGAIGVTMGIIYTFKVRSDEDERAGLCPRPCSWTLDLTVREAELQRQGDRHSKIMVASYTVGAAAIAAGAVLLLTSRGKAESSIALIPTDGGAFVTFTARN
jgi:tetratricopeptide (TPR) repeat protein